MRTAQQKEKRGAADLRGGWGYRLLMPAGVMLLAGVLMACGSQPVQEPEEAPAERSSPVVRSASEHDGQEVVLYSLSLLDTGYRFGGKNPQAGFDCSGMVAYIYAQAVGVTVSGSAASIAKQGKSIKRNQLRPGDLVFFNTRKKPFTHVGIYIGDNRFIHAPSTHSGKVRIDSLDSSYFAKRYHAARTYFE